MRTIRNTVNKDGSRTVTIRLQLGERVILSQKNGLVTPITPGIELVSFNPRYHYRLGGQVDDVIAPHVLTEAVPVYWCSIEQKWIEA